MLIPLFLRRIRLGKPFEATKIHVQIMRFTCYLNMSFNLTKPKWGPELLHNVTQVSLATLTDHFAMLLFAKPLRTSMMLWRCNNF